MGLLLGGYLLGSISTAILVARHLGGPDPRHVGSGNPGATNMLRVGGKKAGALTLLGDLLKGTLAVLAARWLGAAPPVLALVGLAAFLGHLYPVWFGFRGGKGVATALGVLLGLAPLVGLATAATWLATAFVTRISSLSALVAAALAPLWMAWLHPEPAYAWTTAAMSLLLYWRHRSNIRNLLAGREGKIRW
ncbi:MAG: glycerol-3-phosphate 1-O-acyltransferase [Gammaproteobacteria bacterium]|nr:MAG: glycerol-3-phosphate 1-O-acyltransferase [Gammaproteobacteria bacterium]